MDCLSSDNACYGTRANAFPFIWYVPNEFKLLSGMCSPKYFRHTDMWAKCWY